MNKERFDVLTMWCRTPSSRDSLQECAHFSLDQDRVIGATYYIRQEDSFTYILLARDEHGRFQGFANEGVFVSARLAKAAVLEALSKLSSLPTPQVPMRPDTRPGVDLFASIGGTKLNPKFKNLRDVRNASAARQLLEEISRWYVDLDGNFVRDFQTTGYDGRLWELFLFSAFTELGFGFDYSNSVPDFRLCKGNTKLFVEAVTANPTGGAEFDITGPPPNRPANFSDYMKNEMPQKFGSPLLSKIRKRYWEHPDVSGHPFLIAIADFHAPASMVWSHTALTTYLYGMTAELRTHADGSMVGVEKKIIEHVVGQKVVPADFFGQPQNKCISAILSSNAGTIAKFNRMGVRAGFGDPYITLARQGILNDPTPGALKGIDFSVNIEDPTYSENWSDEIEIFHNPNAEVPLNPEIFEGVTQYFLEENGLVWRGPSYRVLTSTTTSMAHPII